MPIKQLRSKNFLGKNKEKYFSILAAVEQASDHPLAKAILEKADNM